MEFDVFFNYATLLFLQYIPNGLIYILAGYAFAKKAIDMKRYLLSSVILAVFGFTAKIFSEMILVNNSNTVPQILILFTCVFLLININQIKIIKAIISSLIVMILQIVVESIYVFLFLKLIFGINIDKIFDGSLTMSSLIGLPYLISLWIFVLLFYNVMMKGRTK